MLGARSALMLHALLLSLAAAAVSSEPVAASTCAQAATEATSDRSLLQVKSTKSAGAPVQDGIPGQEQESSAVQEVARATSREEIRSITSDLFWTTNIGQPSFPCPGSVFDPAFHGQVDGLLVNGLYLKKADCNGPPPNPDKSKGMVCDPASTGCHMWCAPVWMSHRDIQDWGAFHWRCSGWDGEFNATDPVCSYAGKLFTYARTMVPPDMNAVEINFAIAKGCTTEFCTPLWVTVYDDEHWDKFYRWCFNPRGDMGFGACDANYTVGLHKWYNRQLDIWMFWQKHGYYPTHMHLELAVYAEHQLVEVVVNRLLFKVVPRTTTQAPKPYDSCGCSSDEQCCKARVTNAPGHTCCAKDWVCCENQCCPKYYTCAIDGGSASCKPPPLGQVPPPPICTM